MENKGNIIIYQSDDGSANLEVKLKDNSIWMSQKNMGELFQKDSDTIGLHVKNIYKEEELKESSTTEFFSVVQKEGKRQVNRKVMFYNLDMIISVGYRVNSKRGTQFRIWATNTLKDYLVKGYVLNEKKLKEQIGQLNELKTTISLIKNVSKYKDLSGDEAIGILNVLANYTDALELLDRYDYQTLQINKSKKKQLYKLSYKEAKHIIEEMKALFAASDLFGKEKDKSLTSSLNTIYQTFDKKDLYPSIEEKAANLLYLLVKNHSFVDGNKRIAASLFIWFMHKNNLLFNKQGIRIIENNMLVALTLMIAESRPIDKDMLIKVIVNLIQTD